jgi:hypothetical protein
MKINKLSVIDVAAVFKTSSMQNVTKYVDLAQG